MELNLSFLNPYLTYPKDNEFYFTNDEGIEYVVYFSDADGYFPEIPFVEQVKVFGFHPITTAGNSKKFDKKTSDTVIYLLFQFLNDSSNIALYVCDQSDGRQRNRNRLFNHWFRKYNHFQLFKMDLEFEGGVYISAITSENNPNLSEFQQLFLAFGSEWK